MALVVKDRVKETSTTTGTGTLTLLGAASGFQSFSAIGNGNTTYYAIDGGTEWEVGIGTYTSSGTTLSRDTILSSSNGGTAVNFSAGTKNVFVTYPAGKGLYTDSSGNAIALGTPASATLTNATGLPLSTGVTGTLPIANGGTGTTSTTFTNLTTNVTGTLPVANGGTGITSLGTNVATFLATPTSANFAAALTDETGTGANVFATSPTLVTPILGTPTSGTLTSCTGLPLTTGVTGTLPIANGGTGTTSTTFTNLTTNVTGTLPIANGGTNSTATATSGGIGYGTGTAHAYTSAGTSGQFLKSNGSSAPTWATAGISWQSVQTSGFTAVSGSGYPCNTTSSAFTVTLPASPSAGDSIVLTDYAGTWQTNNLTVSPNGNKLDGNTNNATFSTKRQSISLVYIDATQGWIPFSGFLGTIPAQPYTASYLVVAGGGGGGGDRGGGGGAGGFLYSTTSITSGTVYTVTIGGGGTSSASGQGGSGTNSVFGSITATAGGGGGAGPNGSPNTGLAGGSGGGGGAWSNYAGGSGTSGQGNNGGTGSGGSGGFNTSGGGGGGASAVGATGVGAAAGNGGAGSASTLTGVSVNYAGGGGGGNDTRGSGPSAGTGGTGGGANGGANNGTTNTGGGGGGGVVSGSSGTGGSGVVVLSVPTANYSGTYTGTQLSTYPKVVGSNTVLYWTGSGSYTG